jgi:serine/threonine protein kinase/predicted ATPase
MERRDPFGWIGAAIDGRYAIEGVAGEGAFGIVYRARHLAMGEPVAVKCLKLSAAMDADERDRFVAGFREEARLLHRLSRRTATIAQALDVGAATSPRGSWTPYMVMEWLEGETLQDDLDRRRSAGQAPRTLREAVTLLRPIAEALAVAHAEGVCHRDIKPGNLFLSRTGTATTVKLLDFGIAKVLADASATRGAPAGATMRALTPQYGAPEQFDARFGDTGPWTDAFALALVLIELASGAPALTGNTPFELFASATAVDRPSLSSRGVPVDTAIDRVVRRAVEIEPLRRFADVGQMWSALTAAMAATGPEASASPESLAATHRASPALSWLPTARSPGVESGPAAPPPAQQAVASGGAGATLPVTSAPRASGAAAGLIETDPRASTVPSGENRVCTVVFADLSAFTALLERLDAETAVGLLDDCVSTVVEEVETMGGLVFRRLADSVMAVFGTPRASDNDAERAVAAALSMQASLARLPHRALRRARPVLTVAIHTGRVFAAAGAVSRTGSRELTVVGDAVNAAARLASSAPRGGVLVGRDTYRQVVGLFEVERVSGGDGPSAAVRVLGRAPGGRSTAAFDFYGVETKLAGRSAQMAQLTDLFAMTAAEPYSQTSTEHRAQVVTLVGAPGVGKSRMLAELGASARGSATVVVAQSSPMAEAARYGLIAAFVRAAFHVTEDDPPEEIERKLRRGLHVLADDGDLGRVARVTAGVAAPGAAHTAATHDRVDLVGALSAILGARSGTGTPPSGPDALTPDEGASVARQRIAAAFARLLSLASTTRPLMLLGDDAQWADDASLDLIDDLVVRLHDAPVFFALATRPSLFERRPLWGEGKAAHARLDLGPLARRHVEELVRDRLRNVESLPSAFVRTVVDRAEGNPLTLEETLHLLVDAGVLEVHEDAPWLLHEDRLGSLALPPTVQGIVQARLDRLAPEERATLARAAVVGRTFWEGAVERLRVAADVDPAPEPAGEVLARLRGKQLVRAREASAFPAEREYVFTESATHEVAYETLSARVRRALHREVAAWLEETAPGESLASSIALHWDRGGDAARAFSAYVRAAESAAALGQNAEACRLLDRAREIHDATADEAADEPSGDLTPGSYDSDEARVATWRERTALRLELGDVLRRLGRIEEAEARYEQARQRITRTERRTRETHDPKEVLRWEARVDFRLGLTEKLRGDTARARAHVERGIANAIEGGAEAETPAMWALLAALHRRDRDLDACRAAALRGLRVCRAAMAAASQRSVSLREPRFREAVSELLVSLGGVFYSRGQLVRAERCYRQAARAVDAARNPGAARFALNNLAVTRCLRGDDAGARETFLEVLAINERVGDLYDIAVAHNNMAEIENRLGSAQLALEHARRSVQLGEQIHAHADLADFHRNLAQAALSIGDAELALDSATRALSLAQQGGGRVYLGEVSLSMARIVAAVLADGTRPEPTRRRAQVAADTLRAALAEHFDTPELAARAAECQQLLAQCGG